MTYNLSRLENGTNIVDYTQAINDALGGTFSLFFLFAFWVILLMGFKNYDTKVGLIAASAITSVLSWLFVVINWIDLSYVFFPIAMMIVGIIWKALGD